jgi:hypothetical protein
MPGPLQVGRSFPWLKVKNDCLRAPMTGRRSLRCLHWRSEEDNLEAVEQKFQMRFGPEVALVGMCGHPEHRRQVNTRWCCNDWTDPAVSRENLPDAPSPST